ncbi:MAG: hypothetical protein K1X44_00900 [Alphaproteobacteria bacterium]|nr:hypothetical protein [Alphaproteobacteria bacterium]
MQIIKIICAGLLLMGVNLPYAYAYCINGYTEVSTNICVENSIKARLDEFQNSKDNGKDRSSYDRERTASESNRSVDVQKEKPEIARTLR